MIADWLLSAFRVDSVRTVRIFSVLLTMGKSFKKGCKEGLPEVEPEADEADC